MGGILPAPVIIFSTFVGYIAGRIWGALVITVGIFLPAFVFPIFLHRRLVAVSENERLHPFVLGVAAAVIGLIGAVTVSILETSITDVYTVLIAVGAFAALNRWHSKLTVVYVMATAGIVGVVLQHTVV
jgi:chromate transporter